VRRTPDQHHPRLKSMTRTHPSCSSVSVEVSCHLRESVFLKPLPCQSAQPR
jgi:hypothetical protein